MPRPNAFNSQERSRHARHQDPPLRCRPADIEELLARRAALITAIRADHPGLAEARLIRLEDGTFVDAWRWDSAEHMQAALAAAPFPEAAPAWSLTREATSEDGEIVDER